MRFLTKPKLMAVLPPIAASTMPKSVVGTAHQERPRLNVLAASPTTSVTVPPPKATTKLDRVTPCACHPVHNNSSVSVLLMDSPPGRLMVWCGMFVAARIPSRQCSTRGGGKFESATKMTTSGRSVLMSSRAGAGMGAYI